METQVLIVHNIDHVRSAARISAELCIPIRVQSAVAVASTLGPEAFQVMLEESVDAWPGSKLTGILNCADEAGVALRALRSKAKYIAVKLDPETTKKITSIADQLGAEVFEPAHITLDLMGVEDMDSAIRRFIRTGTPT